MKRKYKIVAVSGYFVVLHLGHIQYMEEAKKLVQKLEKTNKVKLLVIVNNNIQQIQKKGRIIHNALDIKKIILKFPFVNNVILSVDTDRTQNRTLEKIKPDYFVKGGDSTPENTPELEICKKIGCKVLFGVGGKKINSSSWILEKLI